MKHLKFLLLLFVVTVNFVITGFILFQAQAPQEQSTSRDMIFAPGPMSAGLRSYPNNRWIIWRNSSSITDVLGFRVNTSNLIEAGTTLRLPNDTWLKGRNNADSADISVTKVNTSDEIEMGATVKIDDFSQGGLNRWATSESVEDDAEITVLAAINASGFGIATINDGAEYCPFIFTAAGAVTLLADATANCAAADTDTDLSIYDSGGNGIHIKNRLGSTQTVKAWVQY